MLSQSFDAVCSGSDAVATATQVATGQFLHNRINKHDAHSHLYAHTHTVIIAFTLDADVDTFNFLYLYFYNTYFSIIAFKLANKVL